MDEEIDREHLWWGKIKNSLQKLNFSQRIGMIATMICGVIVAKAICSIFCQMQAATDAFFVLSDLY